MSGCFGNDEPSLEAFRRQWHAAINHDEPAKLYDLLDTSSRRQIAHQLETLRGLDAETQQQVIDRLGGVAVESLVDLPPDVYFALLWEKITAGKRPTTTIEADGAGSASMLLKLGDGTPQRIMLIIEGGRWAWRLPPQDLSAVTVADAS